MFTEEFLDDTVSADTDLEEASGIAAVVIPAVIVIALFGRVENAVATDGPCGSDQSWPGTGAFVTGTRNALSVSRAGEAIAVAADPHGAVQVGYATLV